MLPRDELCGKGKNIKTYEECEKAAQALKTDFYFEPKLQRCFSAEPVEVEFNNSRAICHKSKIGLPSGHFLLKHALHQSIRRKTFFILEINTKVIWSSQSEIEKRANTADISVLFFFFCAKGSLNFFLAKVGLP